MKGRVNTFLNLRIGSPEILPNNNPNDQFFNPGDTINITGTINGDSYKENDLWYILDNGGFVWSGGVDLSVIDWSNNIQQVPAGWHAAKGKGVKVAILDTGIFENHIAFTNAIVSYEDFTATKDKIDYDGHGTHVAGIIGARNAAVEVSGVACECELIILKVLYDENDGVVENYDHIIAALDKARELGADVINMSFSLRQGNDEQEVKKLKTDSVKQKIKEMNDANIIMVAAAGDKGDLKNGVFFPASCDEVIAVASINEGYFERNPSIPQELDLVGPFVNYYSTYKAPALYKSLPGCSMTTAFVSGIIALAISSNRTTQTQRFLKTEILTMLQQFSMPLNAMNYNDDSVFCYNLLKHQ